jgi:UDP-N-acetylglucosamine:LPS N-acetylglucosamine transferase
MKVLLVCSSGGHLAQLHRLEPWWGKHERRWVTFRKVDSVSLLEGENVTWAFHPTTRSVRNLVRNLVLGWRTVRRFRPDVVVSNGAGVAFPFFVVARLFGSRTVYIEDIGRVSTKALTARLCYPISDLFVLQVEGQRRLYPRGRVAGRLI